MSFKDLIPWRRGHEVPVQRRGSPPTGGPMEESLGLSPFFRDTQALFDRFFDGFPFLGESERELGPALSLDIAERDDEYELSVELPGVDEKDVEVSVTDGTLTLSGEKRAEHATKNGNVHRMERSYGRFERSVSLPGDVDIERVSAKFRQGVLHITCPKLEGARAARRRVPVRSLTD